MRPPEASARVDTSRKDHRPLGYRAQALRLGSVDTTSVTKRKTSSSVKKTERQRKKVIRTGRGEKSVKVEVESLAKLEDVTNATPETSGTPQPEAKSACQLLKAAMGKYCLVSDIFFNELGDLHELESGLFLHQNVSLVLANRPLHHS